MNKKFLIVRNIIICAVSLAVVYLVWIGLQYVFYHNVELDAVDNFMAIGLACYFSRDVIKVDDQLKLYAQFSKH